MAMRTTTVTVRVDRERIVANVENIARLTGVSVYGVVKADAYGLGADKIADALRDVVQGWCVFSLAEAAAASLWQRTGKPAIALGPPQTLDPAEWLAQHVHPAVSTVAQAQALRPAQPIVCVDTGMQRFAAPPDQLDAVIRAGDIHEAFTHAAKLDHVRRLKELAGGKVQKMHAAASALLDQPQAWLDAVRPGLAMYRGAVRATSNLIEVHESRGPIGYTAFTAQRHGVILCGYAQGLRKGPCLINGRPSRVLEVGMQSAYVEIGPQERVGDEVVLLGDTLAAEDVASAWSATPHEVIVRLSGAGERVYR